jgi:hypothetical protein
MGLIAPKICLLDKIPLGKPVDALLEDLVYGSGVAGTDGYT